MRSKWFGVLCVAACLATAAPAMAQAVRISPAHPHAEPSREGDAFNFDIVVSNDGATTLELAKIDIAYLDAAGREVLVRSADANGSLPAIEAIPRRTLQPGETRMYFNPFPIAPEGLGIIAVSARLTFEGVETVHEASATIAQRAPVELRVPVQGRLLVWSAHDDMAHHRRFDYTAPFLRDLGFATNSSRYAYDLVVLDAEGRRFAGDEAVAANWFGFGALVAAPVSGVVVEATSDAPDTGEWDVALLRTEPNVLFGNRVVIEHAPGAFVVLAHLRRGSVRVAPGDRVRAGDIVAAIGHSGSSLFPHLHVQAMDGRDAHAEGAPSLFVNFERLSSPRPVHVRRGPTGTGDVIRARN